MSGRHALKQGALLVALVLVIMSCDLASDDFTAAELGDRWVVIDPLGDGTVSLGTAPDGSGTLDLSIPAGTPHEPWTVNQSLQVVQAVDDEDTGVAVKFLSTPTARFQSQGLLFQEDPDTYLRFDLHSNGSTLRAYAARIDDGTATTLRNVAIPSGSALHLRVARAGDTWTMDTSLDGISWTTRLETDQGLTLDRVAVFAGSAAGSGGTAPAFTARVDHVQNVASPVTPEDGDGAPDVTPPEISDISVSVGATTARVDWRTDEATTGQVDLGLTPALELDAAPSPSTGLTHQVDLPDLTPDTSYLVRVDATDLAGNSSSSALIEMTTTSEDGPVIDVWYGDAQSFGTPGRPQTWVNVLGNLSSTAGVDSFTYSLNGGPPQPLSLGPDTRRLLLPGDFNVEIDHDDLLPGPNTVELEAHDEIGNTVARTIQVLATTDETWPLPYATSWSSASSVADQARVVDGDWSVGAGGISPDAIGYDRLVALGDRTWQDYEVTVPITLLSLQPLYQPPSNGAALGLLVNWQGHVAVGAEQPRRGYEPLGAYASFRWNTNGNDRWQIVGSYNQPQASQGSPDWNVGETYWLKVRSVEIAGGTRFSMRYWLDGMPEPTTWLTIDDTDTSQSGSVVLLAHHVDARFGDVLVTPVPGGPGG
jgi:hypothetical protein